jgi:hypothetical protein
VLVVLKPRAIWVDWRLMSRVVKRLEETVEALRVEALRAEADNVETERVPEVSVEAFKVEMVPELAERVEPTKEETPSCALTDTVDAVIVEAETAPSAMELV